MIVAASPIRIVTLAVSRPSQEGSNVSKTYDRKAARAESLRRGLVDGLPSIGPGGSAERGEIGSAAGACSGPGTSGAARPTHARLGARPTARLRDDAFDHDHICRRRP